MKPSLKNAFPLFIGIVLLAVTLSMLNIATANSPQGTPVSRDMNKGQQEQLEKLRAALQSKDLKTENKERIETKIALLEREATSRAQYVDSNESLAVKQTEIIKATQSSKTVGASDERPVGLIEYPPSTGVSTEDIFTSVWVEKQGDTYLKIFTGYEIQDPAQGVIIVLVEDPYLFSRVKLPKEFGEIVIDDSDGDFLNIRSINGKLYKFDKKSLSLFDEGTGEEVVDGKVLFTPVPDYPYP